MVHPSSAAAPIGRIGERFELDITDLGHDGQGVGRWQERVVFVPGALPEERVAVVVRRVQRRHLEAELQAVLVASPLRRRPPCILAERCGGCSLQHWQDGPQAHWKEQLVVQALRRIGGLDCAVAPLIAPETTLGYRNRATIPLERREGDGQLRAGYYRRGSHRIVNLNRCPVLDPRIDALIAPLKADLEASDWPVDVHLEQEGGLRHLALRVGHHSGEILITLISSHDELDGLEEIAAHWLERWPQVVGVCLNLQPLATNTLMGPETRLLAGRGFVRERFAGIGLSIAADTFFQVNTVQAERLVPLLLESFGPLEGQELIDAYCGIGTFSLPLAAAGARVLGLESHLASVEQARANAAANGLNRASFEQAEVGASLVERLGAIDGLLLDPPRKGLPALLCAAIGATPPATVAYISCNPATLARDLALLTGEGRLRVERVQPIDFFPQTSHVETLAVLKRI